MTEDLLTTAVDSFRRCCCRLPSHPTLALALAPAQQLAGAGAGHHPTRLVVVVLVTVAQVFALRTPAQGHDHPLRSTHPAALTAGTSPPWRRRAYRFGDRDLALDPRHGDKGYQLGHGCRSYSSLRLSSNAEHTSRHEREKGDGGEEGDRDNSQPLGYSPAGMRRPTLMPTLNPNLASGSASDTASFPLPVDWSSTQGLFVAIAALRAHMSSNGSQTQPLPWPVHTALQVARSLSRRLLRIHPTPPLDADDDFDRLFIPTPANPSPVWSPLPASASSTTAAGGSWSDVHAIYSRIHWRHFTNQDFNLALYAHHHTCSSSSPATLVKFLSSHFIPSTSTSIPRATLSLYPDTSSLAVYHLTRAHRSTPYIHSLIHEHMARSTHPHSSQTDRLEHATAADRGIHALLLGQHDACLPPAALVATIHAVYTWYARYAAKVLDAGAPARVLCTALYLVLMSPKVTPTAAAARRHQSVAHLVDLLAKHNPWPLAAYVCLLQHACADGGNSNNKSLVPLWVAEMDADVHMRRAWRASAHVQGLVFRDRMQRVLNENQIQHEPSQGWSPRRHRWPWQGHGSSNKWAELVDEFVSDPLLTSTADNWAFVIRLLVHDRGTPNDHAHVDQVDKAAHVFSQSVSHARPALAAVPDLVQAQCRAGKVVDAVRVVLSVDGGRAVAGEVERALMPYAREIREALVAEDEDQDGHVRHGVGSGRWALWVALAIDCDWIGMLRGMGVLDTGKVHIPRVLVADLMVVLGKRGMVEEASVVVSKAGPGGGNGQVQEWVHAFERGAEAGGFGVRAARAMGHELCERAVHVGTVNG